MILSCPLGIGGLPFPAEADAAGAAATSPANGSRGPVPSVCAPARLTGCTDSNKSKFVMAAGFPVNRRKFLWNFAKGPVVPASVFGDPTSTTGYAVCVYGTTAMTDQLIAEISIPAGGMCGRNSCWQSLGSRGFKYRDVDRAIEGINKLLLRTTPDGSSIQLKGRGESLELPSFPVAQSPEVAIQVVNTDGQCWEAVYTAPADRNDVQEFRDRRGGSRPVNP